jgi:hypothetical protein
MAYLEMLAHAKLDVSILDISDEFHCNGAFSTVTTSP